MAEIIACPNCRKQLQIPENFVGQLVQCPDCRHQFPANVSTVEVQATPPVTVVPRTKDSASDDDLDDDRPRRRRRFEEDDDDDDFRVSRRRPQRQPHRGSLVLILGILGICCVGSPVTGIIAWILGSSDLKEMAAGRMDPSGQGQTQTGKMLGMISVFLTIAGIVGYCLLVVSFGFVGAMNGPRPARLNRRNIMAEISTCSNCLKQLQIPEQYLGETVQCPECGHRFVATSMALTSAPVPRSGASTERDLDRPRRRLEVDDDEEIPSIRRRRRFRDDEDDFEDEGRHREYLPPNRGGLIMALGLVSLVGGSLFFLPFLVGPFAWFMASVDLRTIRDGHLSPNGENMVRTGQVCGIIATVILIGGAALIGLIVFGELGGF